jgi:hypothetical protein
MHIRRTSRIIVLLAGAVSVAGCTATRNSSSGPRWEESGRLARNIPTMFLADTTNRDARTTLGSTCSTRLTDPRDGTLLVLERAQPSGTGSFTEGTRAPARDNVAPTRVAQRDFRGDYSVSVPERYGLAPQELLRLDCVTGKALGIVSRSW